MHESAVARANGFDLLRYAPISGTIESVATILWALGHKLRTNHFVALAGAFEKTVVQCLGNLLNHPKFKTPAAALDSHLQKSAPLFWIELDPRRQIETSESPERNTRWHAVIRHRPEIDEWFQS